jgi:mannitol-1-phosphate/altronate dehydrogenase
MYLDALMRQGSALDWAVCGVGVLPGDARMRDALTAQDCLYTLVEKAPDGSLVARVIGSVVEYLLAPDEPERVVERMADPAVRIVSLTVTEGGYNVDPVTGEFVSDARTSCTTSRSPRRRARASASSSKHWRGGATAASPRSRSCPATTSRATGRSRAAASPPSPRCATPSWPTGSAPP